MFVRIAVFALMLAACAGDPASIEPQQSDTARVIVEPVGPGESLPPVSEICPPVLVDSFPRWGEPTW